MLHINASTHLALGFTFFYSFAKVDFLLAENYKTTALTINNILKKAFLPLFINL